MELSVCWKKCSMQIFSHNLLSLSPSWTTCRLCAFAYITVSTYQIIFRIKCLDEQFAVCLTETVRASILCSSLISWVSSWNSLWVTLAQVSWSSGRCSICSIYRSKQGCNAANRTMTRWDNWKSIWDKQSAMRIICKIMSRQFWSLSWNVEAWTRMSWEKLC